MKKTTITSGMILATAFLLASCGPGAKDDKGDTGKLKAKLEKLKKQKNDLDADIRKLEDQIAKADPSSVSKTARLVSVDTLKTLDFRHYIELQGKIGTDGMGYVAPTGLGGLVKAVYVKSGQKVSKGQLLVKLDDAMSRQGVIAAQQQTSQLKARLAQAQTIYERYQNLWKQNIGAEIQVINAKADVDALSAQLKAAQAQVAMAQEQVNMSNVYAGMSGVVDQVNVRVGEFFSGVSPDRKPQIVIVSSVGLKVEVQVPDNYVASVKKGDSVLVEVRETGKPAFKSVISMVGASIDPTTRSFISEAKLQPDALLKPNQTATMKILDYETKNAMAVPVNLVQSDEKNKYVYVMEKAGDRMVAKKKIVEVGEVSDGFIEIKKGLTDHALIITEGYQAVYDGQTVTTGK